MNGLHDSQKGAKYSRPSAQVQNKASSRVYIFGDGDQAEEQISSDESFDGPRSAAIGLRSRGSAPQFTTQDVDEKEEFLEYDIQEKDTILSLSVKFCCPVAELKRCNQLQREQDFFALRVLKVPIKRHGILSELVQQKKAIEGAQSELTQRRSLTTDDESMSEAEGLLGRMGGRTSGRQSRQARRFLRSMDRDLQRLQSSTDASRLDSLPEVTQHMMRCRIQPLRTRSDGATWGLRWWYVVGVMLCIGIVLPLVLLAFFKHFETTDDAAGQTSTSP